MTEITRLVRAELRKDLPPIDKIESVLRLQLGFVQGNRDFFKIYISERSRFEWTIKDDLGKRVHEKFMGYISDLEEVMCDGIKGGALQGDGCAGYGPWVCGNCTFLRLQVDHKPEGVFLDFKDTDYYGHLF